jgi:hypothetical protein
MVPIVNPSDSREEAAARAARAEAFANAIRNGSVDPRVLAEHAVKVSVSTRRKEA